MSSSDLVDQAPLHWLGCTVCHHKPGPYHRVGDTRYEGTDAEVTLWSYLCEECYRAPKSVRDAVMEAGIKTLNEA